MKVILDKEAKKFITLAEAPIAREIRLFGYDGG